MMELPKHDPPTHRVVIKSDGTVERIDLTPDEITETLAEWRRNDIEQFAKQKFDEAVAAGYPSVDGWCLPIDDSSRASLVELRTQITEGLEMKIWTADSPCPVQILDTTGSPHSLTVGEVRMLIFMAGNHYAKILEQCRTDVESALSAS